MGQTLTNNTGLAYARESSLGVLPGSPDWVSLEPNSFGAFGATITTVAREPISNLRQDRGGTTVDLDAAADYEADMTMASFADFIEAFCFANAVNADLTFVAAPATSGGFTIPAATAAQAAKLQYTAGGPISLVHAAGYALAANNTASTVIELSGTVATSAVLIPVAGNAVETPPTNSELSIAGIRAEVGDIDVAVAGVVATVTSGNNAAVNNVDFTTLGLTLGQRVHIGGLTATNRFGSTAGGSNDSFGSGRVTSIAAATLLLDKIDATLTSSDGTDDGSAGTNDVPCDILFGRFIRNVSVDHANYEVISHHFEGAFPNLFETEPPTPVANPNGYEYTTGAIANQLTWNMPLTSKATATFAFIGTNAEEPVNDASRKSGASTSRLPLFTGAMNTSADFFRLGVTDVDETGLTTDFKDLTAVINNNVSPEKVLGLLGARYMNNGNFQFTVTGEALFNNALVPSRIRNNTTGTMDWLVQNDEGAVAVDVPSCKIGSSGKTYPVNESVRIALEIKAFVDTIFQTSIGVSMFPVFPTS